MVEYIYNSNNYKNAKKNDNKPEEKPQKDNTIIGNVKKDNINYDRHLISNQLMKFGPNEMNLNYNEEENQENNSDNWNIDRVYGYDNSQLKDGEGEGFLKLDSSYENLNMNEINVFKPRFLPTSNKRINRTKNNILFIFYHFLFL